MVQEKMKDKNYSNKKISRRKKKWQTIQQIMQDLFFHILEGKGGQHKQFVECWAICKENLVSLQIRMNMVEVVVTV